MKNLVVVSLLALFLFGCASQPTETAGNAPLKALGDMPSFELDRVAGGKLNSEELKGKVLVVDFWATWCAPCIEEIPNYNQLAAQYKDQGVEVIGITLESGSLEDAKPKVEEFDMKYPVVMGDDAVVEGVGGLIGFPTTFLVGKDGKIYRKYLGMTAKKKERIEQDLALLLAPVD
jgi:cytochrome c biogenesis protein CcmG, thiol:disulfide interchange protein DsbE